MCELFAYNGQKTTLNNYLKEFYSHSDFHQDGWGLVIFDEDQKGFFKGSERADESLQLKELLNKPINVSKMLGHIRYASKGTISPVNSHPFKKYDKYSREYVFEHNGTVKKEGILDRYLTIQEGQTDSERVFCYLMDEIEKEQEKLNGQLSVEQTCKLLFKAMEELCSLENKINFLMYSNDVLYVHYNDAQTLKYLSKNGSIVISTVPLSGEKWLDLPFCKVLAFKDGHLICETTSHQQVAKKDPTFPKRMNRW